ncbi:hypothetical protein [Elioraea tepidiphila]|jgi:hypothetical protein
MKTFIVAVIVAAALAVGAWYLLDHNLQQTTEAAFSSSAVRL